MAKCRRIIKTIFKDRDEIGFENSCIQWDGRVMIPAPLHSKVLSEIHGNYPGKVRIKYLARSYVWCPLTGENIEHVAKSCESCQIDRNMPSKALIHL